MLLTAPEVAERLRIRTQRVHELIRLGLLQPVFLGRQVRVAMDVLEEFVRSGGKRLPGGWRRSPAVRTRDDR